MNRKEFIRLNLLATGGLLLSGFTASNRGDKKKIIVVGAGAAGAMAAYVLTKAGHEVIVLEARNRIGGRIHTNTDWGMNLELGANWISTASDPNNLVANLKDQVGLETERTLYSKVDIFDKHGDSISRIGTGLTGLRTANKSRAYFDQYDEDISWGKLVDTVMDYEHSSDKKKARLDVIKLGNTVSAGGDSYEISGRGYSTYDQDQKDNEQLVLNGYNRVIRHLLKDVDVRTKQTVKEIEDRKEGVRITTDQETFEADYVILTIPISLLQQEKIKFSPGLPDSKKAQFGKMPMGIFNKLVMQFSNEFWDGTPHFLAFQKEILKNSGIVFNYHAYTKKPVLIAFHVGESGKWLESASETEIKKHWQDTFHKSFPNREIEFQNIMTSRWLSDPFSLGSYSSLGIGTTELDVQQLAEPVGRIHFAGEATTYHGHGYVHGAMETGLREANRIMNY